MIKKLILKPHTVENCCAKFENNNLFGGGKSADF